MPYQTRSATRQQESLNCAETLAHMSEIALANLEGIYRGLQSQQDLRYFPESNCREEEEEEGSHTPPNSSGTAAAVFTSGPSSSGSSGLISSPPPTGQSGDHPSGVANEVYHDSQATESAPEDDTSGVEEVEEE
ncbi:hypothetical protein Landi51_03722 [Colletotrichum acutatum]